MAPLRRTGPAAAPRAPDDRAGPPLRLLFHCCHPALPLSNQIALALRLVCRLSVREIARAFLVSERAMQQRLRRAKRRIADAPRSSEPSGSDVRRAAVAAVIYLVFNEGHSASSGEAPIRTPLCEEAIRLAHLLQRRHPRDPELMGLLALLLLQHARIGARLDDAGALVPLEEQDRRRWSRSLIDEGLAWLDAARSLGEAGPYQLQAGIAAQHARAARAAETDWGAIERLYEELERLQPSPVITLNRAVAVAKVRGPAAALALVEPLTPRLSSYFYFHTCRGALLAQLGRANEAHTAYDRALALARTTAEADRVKQHLAELARKGAKSLWQ